MAATFIAKCELAMTDGVLQSESIRLPDIEKSEMLGLACRKVLNLTADDWTPLDPGDITAKYLCVANAHATVSCVVSFNQSEDMPLAPGDWAIFPVSSVPSAKSVTSAGKILFAAYA